jgi:hypothetical protein
VTAQAAGLKFNMTDLADAATLDTTCFADQESSHVAFGTPSSFQADLLRRATLEPAELWYY